MNDRARECACRGIALVARRMLAGEISYLDGARVLLQFGAQAGLDNDPDLEVFALIESETDHLPIGRQRKHWSEPALQDKARDVRLAEEWAARAGQENTGRLVARFAGRSPTTIEILMRKMIERACGQECVDWAIGMLERGYESRSLLLLASLSSPLNHFEVCALRDRALEEIRPPELAIDDPINAYVAEILAEALWDFGALREVLARVAQLAGELEYPSDLQPLFSLYFASEDLNRSEVEWYWPTATRENIDDITLREAQRFIARYAG